MHPKTYDPENLALLSKRMRCVVFAGNIKPLAPPNVPRQRNLVDWHYFNGIFDFK